MLKKGEDMRTGHLTGRPLFARAKQCGAKKLAGFCARLFLYLCSVLLLNSTLFLRVLMVSTTVCMMFRHFTHSVGP